jgi:hypothetical protein
MAPTSPFCKPCSLRSLVSTTISSSLIIGISLSVRLDMRLQSKAASWHVLSRLPDRHARRRRPPQQLDILGRQPIRLVDQIGQAALQPKRLGLALPHRCSLLGVAVAQRPQGGRRQLPGRLRPAPADLLGERGLVERGEGFQPLPWRLNTKRWASASGS